MLRIVEFTTYLSKSLLHEHWITGWLRLTKMLCHSPGPLAKSNGFVSAVGLTWFLCQSGILLLLPHSDTKGASLSLASLSRARRHCQLLILILGMLSGLCRTQVKLPEIQLTQRREAENQSNGGGCTMVLAGRLAPPPANLGVPLEVL